ncbi:putative MFS family arabinose efflux permease [Variovorax paradoxus]|uniref:MFS family arabinose efflux permease n=1 Tax=Variovorax paradoxus TaxID=34073 RepID=A0AAE4C1B9_VARPD|nr:MULTISPECIES: MFS transporter [Variovorax]MBD9665891.1 MFS transporter [Variovorax sp. VRV01]MDP9968676.1 putative MFS family arabinose efflux permease [Variovorax paradoxus]MDR6430142.1 putative MFS family arabinose efflux permease [Variovorax paradoxus]
MKAPLPRPFVHLAWSNLAAQSAEQLSLAAVPLVAVLVLGAGPGEIGFLAAIQTLPFLLLSMPLGVLADRMSRQRLMVASEGLRAASLLVLLALVLASRLGIGWLAVLGFLGAVGTVGFSVAAPALVPALVPRDALAEANGRLELARSAAFTAGPALAGALVAWAGAPTAFVLAAVLSMSAVGLLLRLAEAPRPAALRRHPLLDVRDGARFVWRHELLRPMLTTGAVFNISWFVLQAGYVPYAVRVLGLGAQAVGFTLAMYGAGMVSGALLTSRVVARLPFGRAIQIGPAVAVVAAAAMAATLVVPAASLAALSFFLFGAGPMVWTITTTTLRQSVTAGAMLGRVSAVFLTINAGARPIGAALGGTVGAAWGEPACLLLALAGFVLQAGIIFASRIAGLHRLPVAAA